MKSKSLACLAVATLVLLLGGCASTGGEEDPGASIEDRGGSGAYTSGASQGGAWTGSALEDPNSPLYTKTIYFDFDQSTIRGEYIEILRAHASYLIGSPSTTVLIEGHGDERGSREYNVGLGENRANAIRNFLEAEGVSPSQLNTISYGEERPAAFGNDEAAWAENRRGVLVY
jgi:peptidoglycan-associated lipoprotein